jgi:hypothetical protein
MRIAKNAPSYDEIMRAEQEADNRKQGRSRGFKLMKERDAGLGGLHEKSGHIRKTEMYWWDDPDAESVVFKLRVYPYKIPGINDGKAFDLIFDAEEFRRFLRWV